MEKQSIGHHITHRYIRVREGEMKEKREKETIKSKGVRHVVNADKISGSFPAHLPPLRSR